MLEHDCWELVLLYLRPDAHGSAVDRPVAFGAHFVGATQYAPMIVGLDYEFVRSHHSYRQALRHALLRARAHAARTLLLGMGAPLEKQRFGAKPALRSAFVQASDHYSAEVLSSLAAETANG
jgi:hypothetical protein